jgi:hypothetical protein
MVACDILLRFSPNVRFSAEACIHRGRKDIEYGDSASTVALRQKASRYPPIRESGPLIRLREAYKAASEGLPCGFGASWWTKSVS